MIGVRNHGQAYRYPSERGNRRYSRGDVFKALEEEVCVGAGAYGAASVRFEFGFDKT